MSQWLVIDTNLLLLLVVGRANPALISSHQRLKDDYTPNDYHAIDALVSASSGIVVVPHVLPETSNFARKIKGPAQLLVMSAFRHLIENSNEVLVASGPVVKDATLERMGLTDAILLWLMEHPVEGAAYVLLTADRPLAWQAEALRLDVINYRDL